VVKVKERRFSQEMGIVRDKAKFILFIHALLSVFKDNVEGTLSVINEESGNVERIIEDRNIRSMSDALEVNGI
jgi:hypothetical protein